MPSSESNPTFAESIRNATAEAMRDDESIILFGLGVNDPGRVFGTTAGLVEEFGTQRVFETPTSENAMMGVAVGAALAGVRPIVTHQRADFFYLAMDQLVNSAAKWRFMFGGQFSVPLVVRVIVGRGWGQGPTHSQNMAGWLAQVPGLRVLYPSSSESAFRLMGQAIRDDNPVLIFEDRWLHSTIGGGKQHTEADLESNGLTRPGVTLASFGFGSYLSTIVENRLFHVVDLALIDLDEFTGDSVTRLCESVAKTGNLVFVDQGHLGPFFAEEIIGRVFRNIDDLSRSSVRVLGLPGATPQPTSYGAMGGYYAGTRDIAEAVLDVVGLKEEIVNFSPRPEIFHDIPGGGLGGPF